jgi:hypothetical protein
MLRHFLFARFALLWPHRYSSSPTLHCAEALTSSLKSGTRRFLDRSNSNSAIHILPFAPAERIYSTFV